MTLEAVSVSGFQSLADVSLEIGPGLTTVVGPSSTGKSALMRALRLVAFNASSVPVSVWAKRAVVSWTWDGVSVTVRRGKSLSEFTVESVDGSFSEDYVKCGTSVPAEVSAYSGVTDPVHFVGQFDRPFLVGDAGGSVAKVLGGLTNAHVFSKAAQEGNRRRLRASQDARSAEAQAQDLSAQAQEYKGLGARLEALHRAVAVVARCREVQGREVAIRSLAGRLRQLSAQQERLAPAVPAEAPGLVAGLEKALAQVKALQESSARFAAVVREVESLRMRAGGERSVAEQVRSEVESLERLYAETLKEAGMCPTCGAKQ